jgi:DNA-binding HxlR family transcriptional regulator
MNSQDSTSLIPRHTPVTIKSKDISPPAVESVSKGCTRVNGVLSRIGDKWTVLVVVLLKDGPLRFSELKREIGTVSQRMLTLTLRGLERDGLVNRTVIPTIPPRVDYELTALGQSLRPPVEALGSWASKHLDVIDQARVDFDIRAGAAKRPL